MQQDSFQFIVSHPAFALGLTLISFSIGQWLFNRSGLHPLLNPVAFAIASIITVLVLVELPYEGYMQGANFIHFLLGPATVALAVPLYRQWAHLKRLWFPILSAISLSVVAGFFAALKVTEWLGLSEEMGLSLTLKSVSVPVAIGVSAEIGALEPLVIALVVLTGISGSVVGITMLKTVRTKDDKVIGLAMGVTSHGQGTARAFQHSETAGAFAGLGMALTAVVASLLFPLLVNL